eukprot:12388605-Alexandrium_andersonii.AAC.1
MCIRDRSVVPLAEPPASMEVPASLAAQPLEDDHPVLAPAQVTAQVIVDSRVSWIEEQYHQVDPSTAGLSELARRWRAEHTKAPERFLAPLGIRENA